MSELGDNVRKALADMGVTDADSIDAAVEAAIGIATDPALAIPPEEALRRMRAMFEHFDPREKKDR